MLGWSLFPTLSLAGTHMSELILPEDYPAGAISGHRDSAAAMLELTTDPSGAIIRCNAEYLAGDQALVGRMCGIVRTKHIAPARLDNGAMSYGVTHELARMFVPGNPTGDAIMMMRKNPDFVLTVSRLPGGAAQLTGQLALWIDAQGNVAECQALGAAALPASVCNARDALRQPVLKDAAGNAVPYVAGITVQLNVAPPG